MQILFWGKEESYENLFHEHLANDVLIEKCILPEILKTKNEEVPEMACVLILDGDYDYMFNICENLGYHRTKIIDYSKYLLYKDLENMVNKKDLNLNGIEATKLWYDILHKIIAMHEFNGEVIGACKLFFEKKLSEIDHYKFWT